MPNGDGCTLLNDEQEKYNRAKNYDDMVEVENRKRKEVHDDTPKHFSKCERGQKHAPALPGRP
jgi:hypothetical protein